MGADRAGESVKNDGVGGMMMFVEAVGSEDTAVPEGVRSSMMGGAGGVHAFNGIAQGCVPGVGVMLLEKEEFERQKYVGYGGPVVFNRNITGEIFKRELNVNPWGDGNGWTVHIDYDCRIGGDDKFGPPEAVVRTGERDGRFLLPIAKEYRGDWTHDWMAIGEIDSNFLDRHVDGCRPAMVLKFG